MTSSEKVKRWRAKKKKAGGQSLSVWLDKDTIRMFKEIKNKYNGKNHLIVKEAIIRFHKEIFGETKLKQEKTPDDLLQEVFKNTTNEIPPDSMRNNLILYCKHMIKEYENSPGDMARDFNKMYLKNFSGEKWKVKDITDLLGE